MTTSTPHASVSRGTAPRLEIASTIEIAPASLQAASERLEVGDDAGRRLGVHEEHRAGAALGERRANVLGARRLAPGVGQRDDVAAEHARELLPALAELALRDGEHPVARREEVDDRRLERPGAGRREDEHLVLGAIDGAQPLLGGGEDSA